MDRYRVHYCSQHDLSVGWNLQEIEELMNNFDALNFVKDINDALELYHIKKYIDHNNYLLKWENKGLLKADDHLLCESERNLFSYYLNNNKYTNGPAIRNQYTHGAIPVGDDVQVHVKNYYILLMLLILLLLKIEDEFRIGFKILWSSTGKN